MGDSIHSARSHQLWMRASLPGSLNLVYKRPDHSYTHVLVPWTAVQEL